MNKKSFFIGFGTGIITGIILFIMFSVFYASSKQENIEDESPIKYLEQPVSYEGKEETSFQIFQVFDDAALATEESDRFGDNVMYLGNTVVVLGENLYNDQIVTIKNPVRIGNYSYTNKSGQYMTVPVIDGEVTE